jgi:hypothetical protein
MIETRFRIKKSTKKKFIFHEGSITKDAAFVFSGCLRSYSVDENGFDHILQFAPSVWWIE